MRFFLLLTVEDDCFRGAVEEGVLPRLRPPASCPGRANFLRICCWAADDDAGFLLLLPLTLPPLDRLFGPALPDRTLDGVPARGVPLVPGPSDECRAKAEEVAGREPSNRRRFASAGPADNSRCCCRWWSCRPAAAAGVAGAELAKYDAADARPAWLGIASCAAAPAAIIPPRLLAALGWASLARLELAMFTPAGPPLVLFMAVSGVDTPVLFGEEKSEKIPSADDEGGWRIDGRGGSLAMIP